MALDPRLQAVAVSPGREDAGIAPHLARLPGHLIRRASPVHTELWGRLVSPSVSSVQFAVLASLARREPMDQAGLARTVGLDPASAHAVVHRLRASGLLSVERSAQDARRSDLRLTDDGRRLHDELLPRVEHLRRVLAARLPPAEMATFLQLLQDFVTAG
jgi:DNA-binding MarR family transcriptional regulator